MDTICTSYFASSLTPSRRIAPRPSFVLQTWGMGSGCAPFYNTCKEGTANTRMERFFDEDRFEIYATRDIEAGEELLHTYISLKWRTCFQELNEIVHADDSEHKTSED